MWEESNHGPVGQAPAASALSRGDLSGGNMPGRALRERTGGGFAALAPVLLPIIKEDRVRYRLSGGQSP